MKRVATHLLAALLWVIATNVAAQDRSRVLLEAGDVRVDVIVDKNRGEPGPAMVLLPSSQRDSEEFDDFASRLAARGYTVLRPQPRGMGQSRGPMAGLDLSVLARDVALTIERLGKGRAIVVGHAYGHWVARVTDLNHAPLVRGVVVLGAAARVFPPKVADALVIASDPNKPEADRLAALQFAFFAPGQDPRPWLHGWHPALHLVYRQAGQTPPKEVWFGVSNAPILDLLGAQDPWRPPATQDELKRVLGDKVTVQVIDNASHAMIAEQPAAIVEAITQWAKLLAP